ncbi:MAG: hypothetical protein QXT64_03775 [Desulfurococcaceae archaeon]
MFGPEYYRTARLVAATYEDLLELRKAAKLRFRVVEAPWAKQMNADYLDRIREDEKWLLEAAKEHFREHPLWRWGTEVVMGLGARNTLFLLGYASPYMWRLRMDGTEEAVPVTSAGKIWQYWGLTPAGKLESGVKARHNPKLKGRAWWIATNILMARDPYYTAIYRCKKEYLAKVRGFEEYVSNPSSCPLYASCLAKLARAAARKGGKPKTPACKAHMDGLAKLYLAKIILSHAWEISARAEGMVIPRHRSYVRPKAHADDIPDEEALKGILEGRAGEVWRR